MLFLNGVPLPCLADPTVHNLKARFPPLNLEGEIFYPRWRLPGSLVPTLGTVRHPPTLVALPQPVHLTIGFRLSEPNRSTDSKGHRPPTLLTPVVAVLLRPVLFPRVVVRSLVVSMVPPAGAVLARIVVPAALAAIELAAALRANIVCNPVLVDRTVGRTLPVAHAL